MQLNTMFNYTFVSLPYLKQSLMIQYLRCDDDNDILCEYNEELNLNGLAENRQQYIWPTFQNPIRKRFML